MDAADLAAADGTRGYNQFKQVEKVLLDEKFKAPDAKSPNWALEGRQRRNFF